MFSSPLYLTVSGWDWGAVYNDGPGFTRPCSNILILGKCKKSVRVSFLVITWSDHVRFYIATLLSVSGTEAVIKIQEENNRIWHQFCVNWKQKSWNFNKRLYNYIQTPLFYCFINVLKNWAGISKLQCKSHIWVLEAWFYFKAPPPHVHLWIFYHGKPIALRDSFIILLEICASE